MKEEKTDGVQPIRIFLIDDHPVVRQGLALIFSTVPDMLVVGEVGSGREAVRLVPQLAPDVILLDLVMPDQDGLSTLHELQHILPTARILILTSFSDKQKIRSAFQMGATGFYLKDGAPDALIDAVRKVHGGERALHPAILDKVLHGFSHPSAEPIEQLTPRELEVLYLLGRGVTNREIAQKLLISTRTVTTHVGNILDKLNFQNRTQAAAYAHKLGME